MKQPSIYLILLLALYFESAAQNKIPLIKGKAIFSVEQGTIECDLTLSEYSHIEDYVIRLNSGLNVRNIQSVAADPFILGYDRSFTDSIQTDETVSFYFPANDRKSKFLPQALRFQYTGKYPVIKDTLNMQYQKTDWRGNIAFNNHIVRIDGIQSAWIPTLHDIKNNYTYDELRYDIEIECSDCEYIYINGNAPVKGPKARLKSDVPRELYLFLGKYNIQRQDGITLLNTDFSEDQLKTFSQLNKDISNFLKSYTDISYQQDIYWVQGNITSTKNGWSFVSFPTFTTCGYPPYDLKSTFNKNYKSGFLKTISHELGHYYFGSLKKYNNTLENIINEGFAEFLSIKYLDHKGYKDFASGLVKEKLEYVKEEGFTVKPMATFRNINDTNDRQTYAYDYQTLVLLCIEKEAGKEKMQKWIQLLLNDSKPLSDFDFLSRTLKQAVNNEKIYNKIVNNYLTGNKSIENITSTLK